MRTMETKLVWVDLSQAKRKLRFPLPVATIGTITTADNHYCGTHDGDLEFCIRLSSDDEVAVDTVDGVVYRNHYPHVIIKKAGVQHEYSYQAKRSAFFLIYPAQLKTRFEEFGVDFHDVAWEIEMTPEMASVIAQIKVLLLISRQPDSVDKLDTLSWLLVQNLFLQRPNDLSVADPTDGAIHAVASYLQVHYNESADFAALARAHGMSRRSFFRNWGKCYDNSPRAYVTAIRMEHATAMLERTAMRISEIADKLGYSDPAYFISAFRRHYKTTPLKYRQRQQTHD